MTQARGGSVDFGMVAELEAPSNRKPEQRGKFVQPANMQVVSADGHFSLYEDIFFERFPAHLKDRAPRVWRDPKYGCLQVGINGVGALDEPHARSFALFEGVKGCYDLEARLQDLAIEGVDKEIVFANGVLAMFLHPDLDLREWIYRVYNEYMAELQVKSGGIFNPVGFINFWDAERSAESIQALKNLGLKTFLLPINPGLDRKGERIYYHGEGMRPMWEAIEESGLPVCFHIGENVQYGPVNQVAISAFVSFNPFRRVFGELMFGGILDRHPRLQIAFLEAGINWVTGALQDAELINASYHRLGDWKKLKKDLHSYWADHMFASFQTDNVGLLQLDVLGADRVMWAADYPHTESTYGYSWAARQAVLDVTSEKDARKILGGNAAKLFKL